MSFISIAVSLYLGVLVISSSTDSIMVNLTSVLSVSELVAKQHHHITVYIINISASVCTFFIRGHVGFVFTLWCWCKGSLAKSVLNLNMPTKIHL